MSESSPILLVQTYSNYSTQKVDPEPFVLRAYTPKKNAFVPVEKRVLRTLAKNKAGEQQRARPRVDDCSYFTAQFHGPNFISL
jgi:hypothetical protein